jgi:carbonic anhydrase
MADKNPPQPKSAAAAMKLLERGNNKYVVDELSHDYQDTERRVSLQKIQEPWAVVLSCADSRVVPELIFDCGLGQLFVVRVAGNIANTESIASIEYAVANLPIQVIIVLGHEGCGAVSAALSCKDKDAGLNLNMLLAQIQPAVAGMKKSQLTEAIEKNVQTAAAQLKERSDIIAGAKKVKIVPAIYRLKTGEVDYL